MFERSSFLTLGLPEDVGGDEFPNMAQNHGRRLIAKSPLMADVPGADTTHWRGGPRPAVTAWRGSDMDAYYFERETARWLHCVTGEEWTS